VSPMNATKAAKAVFIVPTAKQPKTMAVEARSEFEAAMWAANKTMPGYRPLCRGRNLIHLGPMHRCRRCYVHCRCEVRQ
jgi:hypothetical protein